MADPLYSGRYTQAFALTASDAAPIAGPNQANGKPIPYCSAIHALTSGNVTARFLSDHARPSVTFPVVAGQFYPFALSYFYTSSTATLLGLL